MGNLLKTSDSEKSKIFSRNNDAQVTIRNKFHFKKKKKKKVFWYREEDILTE